MRRLIVHLLAVTAVLLAPRPGMAQPQQRKLVRVGVVVDGPSDRFDAVLQQIQKEVTGVVKREFDVRFDPKKKRVGDWTLASVRQALDELIADDEVDLVFAHGVIASNEIVQRTDLPKPCIAPFVVDERQQGLVLAKNEVRKNLSYIVWGLDLERDLKAFLELGDFKKIAVVLNGFVMRAVPKLRNAFQARRKVLGVDLLLVEASSSAAEILKAIPASADAVYVGPNTQLSSKEIERLAQGFIQRGLPSFSWFGLTEVKAGMLAGLGSDEDVVRLARRVALNTQSILLGEGAAKLVTAFRRHEQLAVNMETARAINLWPNWSVLADAVLIDSKRRKVKRKLSLESAVKQALRSNLDLAAAKRHALAGAEGIGEARANLLPQLEVNAAGIWIDKDRAGFGNAERTLQWGAALHQSLYSERAWANLGIQEHLQQAREFEIEQVKLDVVRDVAVAYLNLLQAQTVERIQRENLRLSRDNLSLARVRHQIGTAGAGEVFRWEAQIANARRDVIASVARRNQAEIAVNQLLNRPQEEAFITRESTLNDPVLLSSEKRFRDYLNNPFRFRALREFMVREGTAEAPELRQLDAAMDAKKREQTASERSLYVPEVGLSASLTHKFFQGGAGSEPLEIPPLPGGIELDLPMPDKWDWAVGVSASLPLYEGGGRFAAVDRASQEHAELMLQKRAVKARIEQRVRSALHRAGASFPAIRLSRAAADAAAGNLELVTDAYSRGQASIIQLLDAQNQALVSDLAAANSVYQFLVDLMEVERAVGRFGFFLGAADRERFFTRLDAFSRSRRQQAGARPAPVRAE